MYPEARENRSMLNITHVQPNPGVLEAALSGVIDERAAKSLEELGRLVQGAERVFLDLSEVESLDAQGAQQLERLANTAFSGRRVTFHVCSVPFIKALNRNPGLTGGSELVSFIAPLVCANCGREENRLILAKAVREANALDGGSCIRCAVPMRLAVDAEEYLRFKP